MLYFYMLSNEYILINEEWIFLAIDWLMKTGCSINWRWSVGCRVYLWCTQANQLDDGMKTELQSRLSHIATSYSLLLAHPPFLLSPTLSSSLSTSNTSPKFSMDRRYRLCTSVMQIHLRKKKSWSTGYFMDFQFVVEDTSLWLGRCGSNKKQGRRYICTARHMYCARIYLPDVFHIYCPV